MCRLFLVIGVALTFIDEIWEVEFLIDVTVSLNRIEPIDGA